VNVISRLRLVFIALLFVISVGCTYIAGPEEVQLAPDDIPALNVARINDSVSVLNVETDKVDKAQMKWRYGWGGEMVYSSPWRMAETAAKTARIELTKRQVFVSDKNAKKVIRLSVSKISYEFEPLSYNYSRVDLDVELGSGLKRTYHGEGFHAWSWTVGRAFNLAAANAVVKMFNDSDVIDYLTQRKP
jgi:hypothetical protein